TSRDTDVFFSAAFPPSPNRASSEILMVRFLSAKSVWHENRAREMGLSSSRMSPPDSIVVGGDFAVSCAQSNSAVAPISESTAITPPTDLGSVAAPKRLDRPALLVSRLMGEARSQFTAKYNYCNGFATVLLKSGARARNRLPAKSITCTPVKH